MPRYVVLLRGINVGGRKMISMGALREVLDSSGYDEVQTYVQSGNVVLRSRSKSAALAADVRRRLLDAFELEIGVFVRTAAELAAVAAHNPFIQPGVDPARQLHVAFLEAVPDRGAAAALDPHRAPPDELRLSGREIFVWAPNGIGRSKVLHGLERILGMPTTVRNWRTVTSLLEMARETD